MARLKLKLKLPEPNIPASAAAALDIISSKTDFINIPPPSSQEDIDIEMGLLRNVKMSQHPSMHGPQQLLLRCIQTIEKKCMKQVTSLRVTEISLDMSDADAMRFYLASVYGAK